MSNPESEQIGLPFLLDEYEHFGVAGHVNQLIEAGQLPPDTFFRLASTGYKVDHDRNPNRHLSYALMCDMVDHAEKPDTMRTDTQELLWGDLPDAIVDVNSRINYRSYPMLDPMYYRMMDLVSAVHQRRVAAGQALADEPFNRRLHVRLQDERSRCLGIARPLWRLMVNRFHPEWLETPKEHFPSTCIGDISTVYFLGERTMRHGIVSHAVLSDPLVMQVYEEATSTGVKGIGKVGKEDLRLLLSEEHPELLEGHEVPGAS